eukprot:gene1947-2125_t
MQGFPFQGTPFAQPKVAPSIVECIGSTPMVRLNRLAEGSTARVLLKMESMNPGNSVKDRAAKYVIEEAEKRGEIHPGVTVLVEPTSGNMGIGLAMIAAAKGYKLILTMPDSMSLERRVLLRAFGAQLILTPTLKGMSGAVAMAEKIVNETPNGFMLQQFKNTDNPKAFRETCGPEIWYQTDGQIDCLVAGVGTGGTLTGCAQFLKSVKPECYMVAVEPAESPVLSGGQPGAHKIQGLGVGFIPQIFDMSLVDEVITVPSNEAIIMSRALALQEGVLCGISSGAVISAALEMARREEFQNKTIVAFIPSFGERYLSTALFADLFHEVCAQPTIDI